MAFSIKGREEARTAPSPKVGPAPAASAASAAQRRAQALTAENPYEQQRDSRRRLTVAAGALAGVAALSLALGGWQMTEAASLRSKYESGLRTVVVASTDIPAGHVLEASDLTTAQVPAEYCPATSVAEGKAASLVGHAAITDLTAGIPVAASAVQGSEAPASLDCAMSDGNVAYTLDASGSQALSGMLKVGDRVNVISGPDGSDASVVLADAKVIALDTTLSGAAESYSTVTLDLTSDQATELFNATSGGSYHLTLSDAAKKATEEAAATEADGPEAASAGAEAAGQ